MGTEKAQKSGLGLQLHILELPVHILCDILVKLPPFSVIRCRCVCKTLRKLVDDSCFRKLYISQGPTCFAVLSKHRRLLCIDSCAKTVSPPNHGSSCLGALHNQSSSSTYTYRSGIDQIHHHQGQGQGHGQGDGLGGDRFISRFIRLQGPMNLVNSCNGFLCLRRSDFQSISLYYICNPILGEFLKLPHAPSAGDEYLGFSAFGFDPQSSQYKILQLVLKSKSNKIVAELYQLGDQKWSVIESASSARPKPKSAFDPSLNGALHWVTDSSNISELICSFDLQRNEFRSVAPPCHLDHVGCMNKISAISVGVLGGRLCLCYVSGGALFETWLMEEYGVQESWTKRFTIDINSYCGLRLEDKHRPIGFTSYGDMWLKSDSDTGLVSYSAEMGCFRVIHIEGITSNIEATPHVSSFVSLKEILNVWDARLQFEILKPNKN